MVAKNDNGTKPGMPEGCVDLYSTVPELPVGAAYGWLRRSAMERNRAGPKDLPIIAALCPNCLSALPTKRLSRRRAVTLHY